MNKLLASVYKEWLLLQRDWHGLLVLFIMPSVFVLVMSLALQGQFASHTPVQFKGWLDTQTITPLANEFVQILQQQPELSIEPISNTTTENANYLFTLIILNTFDQALEGESEDPTGVQLYFVPELKLHDRALIQASVQRAFADFNTTLIAEDLGFDKQYAQRELLKTDFIQVVNQEGEISPTPPNSVQQSVPAWLIFGMFFIAIPFSTTVIQERQQKTLQRLQTCGVPYAIIYGGKLLPYCGINLLQLLLMLTIGSVLLPLLGAQGLSLDVSLGALLLIAISTSIAALGWASLVAASSKTIEQATVLSGASCIIFAALGGIMVPRFVMPPFMQDVSLISPMAWALEGFLSVLVRGGSYADIAIHCLLLVLLGCLLACLAMTISRWKKNYD